MRTRIAIIGAWILGTVVTSGLAWAAVSRVESGITTRVDTVVSPRDVDRALAPLAVSSTTELATPGATPTTTTVPTVATPATPTPVEPGAPSAPTTTVPPRPTTVAVAPPTSTVATTTAQPTTTTGPAPTVIPTVGGTIAVTCPTPGTIRLVYATPNAGYTYTAGEITSTHLHVRFTKGGQSIRIEAECSGGRVETSFEGDD